MKGEGHDSDPGQIPVTTAGPPAVRRAGSVAAGTIAIGSMALGALAVGAAAVGAVAIGRMAIGHLRLGRTRLRTGKIDELWIARLVIEELRVDRKL